LVFTADCLYLEWLDW